MKATIGWLGLMLGFMLTTCSPAADHISDSRYYHGYYNHHDYYQHGHDKNYSGENYATEKSEKNDSTN
jgi:hypothetical protein